MRRAITGAFTAALFGAVCLAAAAGPADLMPPPLDGWTVSNPTYGESVIAGGKAAGDVPPKRVEVSRDYNIDGGGLRISLNTYDRRGVQIIEHVNDVQRRDSKAAAALAAQGIVPFAFASRQGITMRSGSDGEVTGAALLLGKNGTLTLEGIHAGEPATVALDHVKAYLERIDLDGMTAFVREANAAPEQSKATQ